MLNRLRLLGTTVTAAGVVIAASVISCAVLIICSIAILLPAKSSFNPWESAIVLDGWRIAHQIPVYRLSPTTPATHMYGPLTSYLAALIDLFTGPSLRAVRCASLVATLLTVAVLTRVLCRQRRMKWPLVCFSVVLLLSQYFRTRATYIEPRPDALSVLFAVLAIVVFSKARSSKSWRLSVFGAVLVVIAFGFKQTAAAVALVPILVELSDSTPPPRVIRAARSSLGLIAVLFAIGAIKCFWRPAFFYTFTVPRLFPLQSASWYREFLVLIGLSSVFLVSLIIFVARRSPLAYSIDTLRWVVCAIIVAVPVSTVAFCKVGGAANSYLPAFVAFTSFVILNLPETLEALGRHPAALRQLAGGLLLAVLIQVDLLNVPGALSIVFGRVRNGDDRIGPVVRRVSQLKGAVISPDDPMIAFWAKGYAGCSLKCELDSVAGAYLPDRIKKEAEAAQWVVQVKSVWSADQKFDLTQLGFRPVSDKAFVQNHYVLWKRSRSSIPDAGGARITSTPSTAPVGAKGDITLN